MEINTIKNMDCMVGLKTIPDGSVDLVLTDIPYGGVNRDTNGLRNLNKEDADVVTFNLDELTDTLCKKTKGSIYMFCGWGQLSTICEVMTANGMSTRIVVWEKTNPSPMNGQYMWLSGVELCVYGRKKGAVFNYNCRNSVLRYPCGEHDIHPTQKPVNLMRDLILASTNVGGVVLDPFMGSGTTAVAAHMENRNFVGFEINKEYYERAMRRVNDEMNTQYLF